MRASPSLFICPFRALIPKRPVQKCYDLCPAAIRSWVGVGAVHTRGDLVELIGNRLYGSSQG